MQKISVDLRYQDADNRPAQALALTMRPGISAASSESSAAAHHLRLHATERLWHDWGQPMALLRLCGEQVTADRPLTGREYLSVIIKSKKAARRLP